MAAILIAELFCPAQTRSRQTMHLLDITTILVAGLMVGNELAVSLFINPALWQLDERAQATAVALFARSLGKAMPFWYVLSLLLMIAEATLHRHRPGQLPLLIAALLWTAVILYTIAALVPINQRLAALVPGSPTAHWQQQHHRWDTLHRWRVLLLTAALVALTSGILEH
jgi:hypothetical protein